MHIRYIDDDITVIVLSNTESHAEFIADGLSAIALNKSIVLPYLHKEKISTTTPGKYTGKYMMQLTRPLYMADFPIAFAERNGRLFIHSDFTPEIMVKPESEKKFFLLMALISK